MTASVECKRERDDEYVHTVPVKSLDPLLFLMFLKEMYYAHQACIYSLQKQVFVFVLLTNVSNSFNLHSA